MELPNSKDDKLLIVWVFAVILGLCFILTLWGTRRYVLKKKRANEKISHHLQSHNTDANAIAIEKGKKNENFFFFYSLIYCAQILKKGKK